jgi:hypothetical protein
MKTDISGFFLKKSCIKVLLKSDKNNAYLHMKTYIGSLNSCWNEKFCGQSFREYKNTHFVLSNIFTENRAAYEILAGPRGLAVSDVVRSYLPAEIVGSNPAVSVDVSSECCVLSDEGLCDEVITRPE